jgi:FkbM family methyltransferase
MNLLKKCAAHVFHWKHQIGIYLRRMAPGQMWGRKFDLDKAQLVGLKGFSLYVMPNDYIGASIIQSKVYEPHVTRQIERLLKRGDVFLDIGANMGYFSMLASKIVDVDGKVLAFEPNPTNVQLILRSLQEGRIKNVLVYPLAASNSRQVLRFTNVGTNAGVVTQHSRMQRCDFLAQSVALDDVLGAEQRVDLIMIDIEAHEPFALLGMQRLIARCRPTIITEYHPWAMRLNNVEAPETYLGRIFDLGYRISVIVGSGELRDVSSAEEVTQYLKSLQSETAHLDLLATCR